MKLQFVFAAALALALVGCFGPSREQIAMQDGSNCTGMGFKEGSPEYAQCRMAMLQRRDNADAAYRARVSSTLQNFNNTVQNNRVDYSTYNNTPPYSPPRRVTCRQTLGIGNPVVCE